MKKASIFLSLLVTLAVTSCREKADFSGDPSNMLYGKSADSYTNQFKVIWNAINNGFNFWDITDVDWDARYNEFLPQFQAMDEDILKKGDIKDKQDTIFVSSAQFQDSLNNGKFATIYKKLTAGLRDGHMALMIQDPYKPVYVINNVINPQTKRPYEQVLYTLTRPVEEECKTRSYYHDRIPDSIMYKFIYKKLEQSDYILGKPDSASWKKLTAAAQNDNTGLYDDGYYICARLQLPGSDKVIPYLWLGHFAGIEQAKKFAKANPSDPATDGIKRTFDKGGVYDKFREWVCKTPKEQLAGVILDVRENGGGDGNDLKYFYGMFQGKDEAFWELRHKEGMGKYDMSVWVPANFGIVPNDTVDGKVIPNHRDLAAENIPFVGICDLNSISCSEITSQCIRGMGGYLVGERTHGGHGELISNVTYYDLNYCGVVGDQTFQKCNYFIYTGNYENRPIGQSSLEGYGITPDKLVEHKPNESPEQAGKVYTEQFQAAIDYIKSKQ